jgi:sterol 24-C-methyltransferase
MCSSFRNSLAARFFLSFFFFSSLYISVFFFFFLSFIFFLLLLQQLFYFLFSSLLDMSSVVQSVWEKIVHFSVGNNKGTVNSLDREAWNGSIDEYNSLYDEDADKKGRDTKKINERKEKYATMINHYYNLVTDFYEYGWGQSFHFAPRFNGETFAESIARHEHFLALYLGLRPGMKVLDMGSGVGGPMRAIARFSGANVTGITINHYQVKRSGILNQKYGLEHLCGQRQGNFMELPFEKESFDAAYAIEATCHAPDRPGCFRQVYEALKPGGMFCGYEWCMTDAYDSKNEEHNLIKHEIEAGDSLPDLLSTHEINKALEKAGFEIVDAFDVAETAPQGGNDVPWYSTLQGGWKLSQVKHSKAGRFMTQCAVDVMEACKLAPTGTSKTHAMLCMAATALARGGETGIFTPMYFFCVRKPE